MTVATVLSKALLMWSLQSSKESVLYLIQQKRVQLLPQYDQQLGQLDENTRAYFTERTDWSFSPINDHPNPQATWWRCEFRKSRQAKQCETLSKTVHQTTPTTLNGQRLFSYLFFFGLLSSHPCSGAAALKTEACLFPMQWLWSHFQRVISQWVWCSPVINLPSKTRQLP